MLQRVWDHGPSKGAGDILGVMQQSIQCMVSHPGSLAAMIELGPLSQVLALQSRLLFQMRGVCLKAVSFTFKF